MVGGFVRGISMTLQFIGFIEAETQRAYLFQDHFWHGPEWLPKSQAEVVEQEGSHEVVIFASSWISSRADLTEFAERKNDAERG